MALKLTAGVLPVGIQVTITSGSQFDGAKSTTAVTLLNGVNKFATDTKGGLFDFECPEPVIITNILADFVNSRSYTLSVVDLDAARAPIGGSAMALVSGSGATLVYAAPAITLGAFQALQLVTSGGSAATLNVRVWAVSYKGFHG